VSSFCDAAAAVVAKRFKGGAEYDVYFSADESVGRAKATWLVHEAHEEAEEAEEAAKAARATKQTMSSAKPKM
jgi:hypothetical protein